ncbi:MAG: 23S rRNA (guanosine(2251)-2'-O)-methyltransferase RlmB [Clostridia bacterium]|nr:23S rRNA (guanosine(2251)-2'-O)-methyltransferase RlmB [Clostridia bacterium]
MAGRNPIREALKSGRSFEKLLVSDAELTGSAREILALARERGVVVQYVDRRRLDALYPNHQGMIGYVSAAEYSSVEDIFDLAGERGEDPFIVILDGVTDPHNLGAIARTAECIGAHGIIIPYRRSVGLTPSAVKASAGAFNYIKVAREVNLNRAIEQLKSRGVWVTGCVMDGQPLDSCNLKGPMALVIGAEEDGISRLVRNNCDQLATIPMTGHISSFNASVAAGIMLYEIARARRS